MFVTGRIIVLTYIYTVNEKSYRVQNGRDLDMKPRLATSLNVKIDVSYGLIDLLYDIPPCVLPPSFDLSWLG